MNNRYDTEAEGYWILLYDAECALCSRFAAHLRRFDKYREIEAVSFQDYEFSAGESISYEDLKKEVHMLGKEGECLFGGEVIQQILLLLPQMRPFQWMVKSGAGKALSKAVYSSISLARRCSRCGF